MTIRFFIGTFFTPFPQILYNEANCRGNMAYAGIGLGLIRSQQTFWLANSIAFTTIAMRPPVFVAVPAASLCVCLYAIIILKTAYLRRLMGH